jgi:hypothetical protein
LNNGNYSTTETSLATYLIQEGFVLSEIQYETKTNGKKRAIFIFEHSPHIVKQAEDIYYRGDATINLLKYEHIRSNLLDRVKRELP